MLSLCLFLKKIFNIYSQFLLKITTKIGSLLIYFLGIFLGRLLYKFSHPESPSHWQKTPKISPPEVMY